MRENVGEKMMKMKSSQEGWTMWSLLIALTLVVFFGYMVMKLAPLYTANSQLKSAMDRSFDKVGNVRTMSKSLYLRTLQKQVDLDQSYVPIDFSRDISFKRDNGRVFITVKYDRVEHLFHNINLKLDFEETVSRPF